MAKKKSKDPEDPFRTAILDAKAKLPAELNTTFWRPHDGTDLIRTATTTPVGPPFVITGSYATTKTAKSGIITPMTRTESDFDLLESTMKAGAKILRWVGDESSSMDQSIVSFEFELSDATITNSGMGMLIESLRRNPSLPFDCSMSRSAVAWAVTLVEGTGPRWIVEAIMSLASKATGREVEQVSDPAA